MDKQKQKMEVMQTEKPEIQILSENFRNKGRKLQRTSKLLIYSGIALSIVSLFFEKISTIWDVATYDLEWAFVVLSLISQIIAQYYHSRARKFHLNSRDGYRWFLISSSLDDEQTKINQPLDDLKQKAVEFHFENTNTKSDGSYYSSKSPMGLKRLVENLHESIYFTESIMDISNNKRTKSFYVILGITLIVLVAVLTLDTERNIDPYLTSLATISFVVAIVIDIIAMSRTSHVIMELGIIKERVRNFKMKTEDELSKDKSIIFDFMAKYYSLTSEQEVLSNKVYKKHNLILSKNYRNLNPINEQNNVKK